MDIYKVNVTKPAENDLRDIAMYIASQFNAPTTALNMVRTIRASIAKLETNALLYPLVRDERLAALGYRSLMVKSYMVFYIVNGKDRSVDVDRILYGKRYWQALL
jgi:plasmid stabilization system protein ParE